MIEENINDQSASVIRYVIIFTAIYIVILVLVQLLAHIFNIKLGYVGTAIMLFGPGLGAMIKFVNDHRRTPKKIERIILFWLCHLSFIIVSILTISVNIYIVSGVFILHNIGQGLSTRPVAAWIVAYLFVMLINYVVLRLIFGWGARYYLTKM